MSTAERSATLIDVDWPDYGPVPPPAVLPVLPVGVYRSHLASLTEAARARGLSHVLMYGDREHAGNLTWATGFDPRYEEALLVLATGADGATAGPPLLLAGNECLPYVAVSPLLATGELRSELYQPFSLPSQPRGDSRRLIDILRWEGIGAGSRVGMTGWKYLTAIEHEDPEHAVDVPSHLTDTVRALAGHDQVVNLTDALIHPGYGLRTIVGVDEIAVMEYANAEAARAVRAIITAIGPAAATGLTDLDVMRGAGLAGLPLGCHPTFATGVRSHLGLSGPTGVPIRIGEPLSFNVCHWGSNVCRAGWVAAGPEDLPAAAQDYVAAFAGPYVEVMSQWLAMMTPGTTGGAVHDMVHERLPDERYGITLNPGHLIGYEEWLSSPIAAGSDLPLRSGMVLQIDVIPAHPVYGSTRMEEGILIADLALRTELAAAHPDVAARCRARRRFMIDVLGYDVPETVLPLADSAGLVVPFFASPDTVIALR